MLFVNATIHTMEGRIINNGWLLTNGNKIQALGELQDVPAADDVYDAHGAVLVPGFIDAHTHLGMWEDSLGFEGADGNEATDATTPQLRAIDAINPMDRCFTEAAEAGVTTVVTGPGSANPIGGQMVSMKTSGRRIDDMLIRQPQSVKFAFGENPKSVYQERHEMPTTRMATAAIIRDQLFKAQKYLEKIEKAGRKPDADAPDFDFKCASLIPLLKREVQAHMHAHRADDIFTAIRIAKEFNLDYVIVHGTEGHLITDALSSEGTRVLSGPFLCDRCKPELRNMTPEAPGRLNKAGIETAIITDHQVIPIQYLAMCAGIAVKKGMDYEAALRAITINPARILGIDARVGSLEPGKDADLSVFSTDPLGVAALPDLVLINGERVK